MLHSIVFAFWFFLPAGLANMFPVFASRIPGLKNWEYPMDFFSRFREKRVFGDHKTMRGFVVGVGTAIVTVWIQKFLFLKYGWGANFELDYASVNVVYLGALLGAGAILGDAVKSFFKRQVGIPSGEAWLVFDQVDYILGGIVCSALYIQFGLTFYFYILLVYTLLHLLVNVIGYFLGLKKDPI